MYGEPQKSITVRPVSNGFIVEAMVPFAERVDPLNMGLERMAQAVERVVGRRGDDAGERDEVTQAALAAFGQIQASVPVNAGLRPETIIVASVPDLMKVVEKYATLGVLVAP